LFAITQLTMMVECSGGPKGSQATLVFPF